MGESEEHSFAAQALASFDYFSPTKSSGNERFKKIIKTAFAISIFVLVILIYLVIQVNLNSADIRLLISNQGGHNHHLKELHYTVSNSDLVPRTCGEYGKSFGQGIFTIDPLKQNNGGSKFKALCDFKEGSTILKHDKPAKYDISPCEGDKCFKINVNYSNITLQNIKDLLSISENCYQEITFDCIAAQFTDFASWTDANGEDHKYFTGSESNDCQCSLNDTCLSKNEQVSISCNCDYKDSSPRQDKIRITSKKLLPLKSFHYGHMDSKPHHAGSVQIGPLVCQGLDFCNEAVIDYRILNDPSRNVNSDNDTAFSDCNINDQDTCLDALDDWNGGGWYRFMPPAGTMLPTYKNGWKKCGGVFPSSYRKHASIEYPTVNASKNITYCTDYYYGYCSNRGEIMTRNCGTYYIYYLKPQNCIHHKCNDDFQFRYCAE